MRLEGMTLAFVPPRDSVSQEKVAYWAGSDVEKIPDHLWTGLDWAGPAPAAAVANARLEELATRWRLSIVEGPLEYACPRLAKTR